MQSRRVRAGIVLLLAVIALGAAGAAVDSTGSGGGGSGLGEGSATGIGGGEEIGMEFEDTPIQPLIPGDIIPRLIGILAVGGMVAAVVTVVLTVLNRDLERLYVLLKQAGVYSVIGVVLLAIMYLIFTMLSFASDGGGETGVVGAGAEGASEAASDTGVSIPPIVGVGIVLVVFMLLLIAVARSSEDEQANDTQVEPDPGEPVSRTGGRASSAPDVGRQPASNEIYRAWLSLARAAGADARQDTPEEVAERAVAAGVDEDAAREITECFESVRYGDREPTDDLERRADRARTAMTGER